MQFRRRGIRRQPADPDPTSPFPPLRLSLSIALLGFCSTGVGFAQETQRPAQRPDAPSASKSTQSARRNIPPVALFVTLNRKSIVFPDIAADTARMSPGQKFKLFIDNSISLHTLAGASLGAGISQAADTPHGYGQGEDGYAKRFGSSMARVASNNFFGTFMLASALHQDPRFFPEADPTFGQSIKYSARRIFVTRSDEGREVGNWSGLIGPLLGEGLANSYWPEQDRTAGQTLQRYGTDLAVHFGGNMLREYWPVFFRKLRGAPRP